MEHKLVTARRTTRHTRLQVYLPDKLATALDKYLNDVFPTEDRVVSVTMRKALHEFLKKEGYID